MNLPNYFLADLPPDATLTPKLIADACHTLRRNRAQFLAERSTRSIVALLADVAKRWLDAEFPLRKLALDTGPQALGFSRETLGCGLDVFFRRLTPENFNALFMQELGHAESLDAPVVVGGAAMPPRLALAAGPELLVHIAAGNIPSPALMSLILGLLTRSAQFMKCASGASLLPRLFAHSLHEADAKLASCLEIAEWRGGDVALEKVLFAEADCVTATGSDEALASVRSQLPAKTRFVGYGHRVSFAFVAAGALSRFSARELVTCAADDVVAWDQLGCLSPHVIHVEESAELGADQFAEMLAGELAQRERTQPRGRVPTEIAATIASRRAIYAVRAAHSADTRVWQSEGSTAWTVVYEAEARFQASCGHRWVYVKPVKDLAGLLVAADSVQGQVSSVGLAAPEERAERIVAELARWGVTRVCPLGKMQDPPLTWRHDGRPALGDLVTWCDWEK